MVRPDFKADMQYLESIFESVSRILLEHFGAEIIDAKTADQNSVKLVQACLKHVGTYGGRTAAAQAASDIGYCKKILSYCEKVKKSASEITLLAEQNTLSINQTIETLEHKINKEISYLEKIIMLPVLIESVKSKKAPVKSYIGNVKGRPPHTGANGVAVEAAKLFERLTGKPATLSNFTNRDRNRFGGRYYEFLRDILKIFDLEEHVDGAARHSTKRISSK